MLPVAAATLPAAAEAAVDVAVLLTAVSAPGASPAQPAKAAEAPTTPATFIKSLRVIFIMFSPFLLGVSCVRTGLCLSTFFSSVATFHSLCSFMLSKLYSIRSAVAREKFRQIVSFCNANQFFAQKRPRNRSTLEQIRKLSQNYCFKIELFIDLVPCVSFLSSMQKAPGLSRGPVSVNFCFYSINFPPFAFRLAPVI